MRNTKSVMSFAPAVAAGDGVAGSTMTAFGCRDSTSARSGAATAVPSDVARRVVQIARGEPQRGFKRRLGIRGCEPLGMTGGPLGSFCSSMGGNDSRPIEKQLALADIISPLCGGKTKRRQIGTEEPREVKGMNLGLPFNFSSRPSSIQMTRRWFDKNLACVIRRAGRHTWYPPCASPLITSAPLRLAGSSPSSSSASSPTSAPIFSDGRARPACQRAALLAWSRTAS